MSWLGIGAANVALELVFLILPLYLIWGLKLPKSAKFYIMLAFSFRFPVSIMTVLRVIHLVQIQDSRDYTFDLVPAIVLTQAEMHYGLISATIPCIRSFWQAWNTGSMTAENILAVVEGGEARSRSQSRASVLNDKSNSNTDITRSNSRATSAGESVSDLPPQIPAQILSATYGQYAMSVEDLQTVGLAVTSDSHALTPIKCPPRLSSPESPGSETKQITWDIPR